MPMQILEGPFGALEVSLGDKLTWTGRTPQRWANSVEQGLGTGLPDKPVHRGDLRAFCRDESHSLEACFLTVMAWGGMKVPHGQLAWSARGGWLKTIAWLREDGPTRTEAFARLSGLRSTGKLPGIGPAFFTKLMFFLRTADDAYILDQWTAKSVHVLTGQYHAPPLARHHHRVPDDLSTEDYEIYCLFVERLAQKVGRDGPDTEHALFSVGGKRSGSWRRYVRKYWQRP